MSVENINEFVSPEARVRRRRRSSSASIQYLDLATELLIYLSVIIGPWALGTVHDASIMTMNTLGGILGCVWFVGWRIRRQEGARRRIGSDQAHELSKRRGVNRTWIRCAFVISFCGLVYILVHSLNARAEFDPSSLTFLYNDQFINWLPHSIDSRNTWREFWEMGALWIFFWVIRDWMRRDPDFGGVWEQKPGGRNELLRLPVRIRRFLFVLILNSGLLALVSILQRLDGTEDLLWFYHPKFQSWDIGSHFGPFGYRGNAATFFNVVWPVGLFLLIMFRRELLLQGRSYRRGSGVHILLAPVVGLMAIAPLISSSRAGAVVTVALVLTFTNWYLISHPNKKKAGLTVLVAALIVVSCFMGLGGDRLLKRVQQTASFNERGGREGRLDIYQHFGPILGGLNIWGTGPGTFSSVYFVYRQPSIRGTASSRLVMWSAWAHSDPFEYLITYGIFGVLLLGAGLGFIVGPPIFAILSRKIDLRLGLIVAGLGGMMLHSCVDFPFQVYSLQHLFVMVAAGLSILGEAGLARKIPGINN